MYSYFTGSELKIEELLEFHNSRRTRRDVAAYDLYEPSPGGAPKGQKGAPGDRGQQVSGGFQLNNLWFCGLSVLFWTTTQSYARFSLLSPQPC